MSAKEIKYFDKVSQGITDGKYLNISTGREVDDDGATFKKLKGVNSTYKVAGKTQEDVDAFIKKFKDHEYKRKQPSPPRQPSSPIIQPRSPPRQPSPKRTSPQPGSPPRKPILPPSPTFTIQKRKTKPKSPPKKPKSPPKKHQSPIKKPKSPPKKPKSPPKTTQPVTIGTIKLPGYTNPKRCGPKNAYVCPDDLICNVDTNNCVKKLTGKKSIETIVNQLNKEIKIGGTSDKLQKAMEAIKKDIQKTKTIPDVAPKVTVVHKPVKNITITRKPRLSSPSKISPQEKTEMIKKAIKKASPKKQTRKTPSPPPVIEAPSPVKTSKFIPISPPSSPVRQKGDTMSEFVQVLSEIGRPKLGAATSRQKPKKDGELPIPSRPVLPEVQSLTEQLYRERMNLDIQKCLGFSF